MQSVSVYSTVSTLQLSHGRAARHNFHQRTTASLVDVRKSATTSRRMADFDANQPEGLRGSISTILSRGGRHGNGKTTVKMPECLPLSLFDHLKAHISYDWNWMFCFVLFRFVSFRFPRGCLILF